MGFVDILSALFRVLCGHYSFVCCLHLGYKIPYPHPFGTLHLFVQFTTTNTNMLANNGALGATFQIARLFQGCSLIAIIGMTANFISEIVSSSGSPPSILIGTIAVVCCLTTPQVGC